MRDGPRDECGVVALALDHQASQSAYYALYALQHRGQEAAGIAATRGSSISVLKDSGLVAQVFDRQSIEDLAGRSAIGHVRYSTKGGDRKSNVQPIRRADRRQVALAHNGNLLNAHELKQELQKSGVWMDGTSDSEIIAALLSLGGGDGEDWLELAVEGAMNKISGAYSAVALSSSQVIAFRDPAGVRPLVLGSMDGGHVVASETCALDILGARFIRDVLPGECLVLRHNEIRSRQILPPTKAHCVFESIYFSRPDSVVDGKNIQSVRRRMGEILAEEHPAEADLVIGVPDSGNPAAGGFSFASGLPRDEGLVKNRYVARTFIEPGQDYRMASLRMKFNPIPAIVSGKRLVVVDDSIVRGNTTKKIVQSLRGAGAREIHLRISSPPILHPCYYGIDMHTRSEMIAHGKSGSEIAQELGADSLGYLSLPGVYRALGAAPEMYCDACFSGHYPLGTPSGENEQKNSLED